MVASTADAVRPSSVHAPTRTHWLYNTSRHLPTPELQQVPDAGGNLIWAPLCPAFDGDESFVADVACKQVCVRAAGVGPEANIWRGRRVHQL